MNYPVEFQESLSEFPTSKLGPLGQAAWESLTSKGYEVKIGMTKDVAASIHDMSQEPSIREYCPKDLTERFSDDEAVGQWLKKGRATFVLVADDGTVVGYGWVGLGTSSHVPDGKTTFAIRLGEASQGKGLATDYARLMIAGAAILYGASNVWLETWESNGGAVHIYHKLGAVDVAQVSSKRPRPNGQAVDEERLYMMIPDNLLNP